MSDSTEQAPDTTDGNPFSLLAHVLFQVRHALEVRESADRPPRWVRIGRGAPHKNDTLGGLVSAAVNGMGETLSYMLELTLDLQELLQELDAASAMAQVMTRLVHALVDEDFRAGLTTLLGESSVGGLLPVMASLDSGVSGVASYLEHIPEPEDVSVLGYELYRLLCIEQRPFPRSPADNAINVSDTELLGKDHLSETSGKLRLMTWSYGHGITSRGLGYNEADQLELFKLGSRRLYATGASDSLPAGSELTWSEDGRPSTIFDMAYGPAGNEYEDLKELVDLLREHEYNDPPMPDSPTSLVPDIVTNLLKFQAINELPISGELDNDTLNRLLNLDYAGKNICRARPHDGDYPWPWEPLDPTHLHGQLRVVNADADHWADEGLSRLIRAGYGYYEIPTTPTGTPQADAGNWPEQQGWLSEGNGFVAIQSRRRTVENDEQVGRFDGGILSEGEAAQGAYFFFARSIEPWRAGRSGTPGSDALFNGPQPAAGFRSRMYQWIPLPDYLKAGTALPPGAGNWQLWVYASVQQRSLFSNRGQQISVPDQGLIRLELYGSDVYNDGTISVRSPEPFPVPDPAKGRTQTDWFPNQVASAHAWTLPEVDRKRRWTYRETPPVQATDDTIALCLVAEGSHQAGYDTDAYFDDFKVHYFWKLAPSP